MHYTGDTGHPLFIRCLQAQYRFKSRVESKRSRTHRCTQFSWNRHSLQNTLNCSS